MMLFFFCLLHGNFVLVFVEPHFHPCSHYHAYCLLILPLYAHSSVLNAILIRALFTPFGLNPE